MKLFNSKIEFANGTNKTYHSTLSTFITYSSNSFRTLSSFLRNFLLAWIKKLLLNSYLLLYDILPPSNKNWDFGDDTSFNAQSVK